MKENVVAKVKEIKGVNEISLKDEIVVFGSTYMAKFPFYELVNKYSFEHAVYNRSIEGLTCEEALEIVNDCVIELSPRKVFIALGEEDCADSSAIKKYNELVMRIRRELPNTNIFLICLAENGDYERKFNANIESLCKDKRIQRIRFSNENSYFVTEYKSRFKQLAYFFRDNKITMLDAFKVANI